MRLDFIRIPAFGPFTDFSLELPRAASDVHLIYGPNEAGKSSLLRAIRDLFFGIHAQTSDNFRHDYKSLRLIGRVQNAAGETLTFQRRKGNRNTLLDEAGQPLPDNALSPWLHTNDRDFFSTMFGLDFEQLRRGAEALLQGQGALGQSLFSAAMAGTPVHRVLNQLENEAAELFRGAARTRVSIRPALAEYENSQKQCRDASVSPERWSELADQLAAAGRERDKISQELREARVRLDWLSRCTDAMPSVAQLHEQERLLTEQVGTAVAGPQLDHHFVATAEGAITSHRAAEAHVRALTETIATLESRGRENQPDPEILKHAGEIEAVHQQLEVSRSWQQDLSELKSRAADVRARFMTGLDELGSCEASPQRNRADRFFDQHDAGPLTLYDSLRLPLAEELRIRETARNLQFADTASRENGERVIALQHELVRLDSDLCQLMEADDSELSQATRRHAGAFEVFRQQQRAEHAMHAARRKLGEQHASLPGAPADIAATAALALASAAVIRQFESDAAAIEAALTEGTTEVRKADRELAKCRRELSLLEHQGALPTRDLLQNARRTRDRLWQEILSAWHRGNADESSDGVTPSQEFERQMRNADEVADRLVADAERIAKAEELRFRIGAAEAARGEAVGRHEQLAAQRAAWEQRWLSLWSARGIVPLSPPEMLDWCDAWNEFRKRYEQWDASRNLYDQGVLEIQAAETDLRAALGDTDSADLLTLKTRAEKRLERAMRDAGARDTMQQQRSRLAADLAACQAAAGDLAVHLREAQTSWHACCQLLSLPSDTSPAAGMTVLERRQTLAAVRDEWHAVHQQVRLRQQELEAFEHRVRQLAEQLQLAPGSASELSSRLWSELKETRARHERHRQSESDREAAVAQLSEVRRQLDTAEQQLDDCLVLGNVPDPAALLSLLQQLKARHAIQSRIDVLRDRLHALARGEALEEFLARVREFDAERLAAEIDDRTRHASHLELRLEEQLRIVADLEAAVKRLEATGDDAAMHRQNALNTAARVTHDAARFLRLHMAIQLLKDQIEQFRQANQQPLLQRASELFRTLTGNSFEGLGTAFDPDDNPVLTGIRAGTNVTVDGMSEGTRDQLYLALRLAAIELHHRKHEPMPIILDDLLMTFDDDRARAILPVLCDIGRRSQVLLFTHHLHLSELARQSPFGDAVRFHWIQGQPEHR